MSRVATESQHQCSCGRTFRHAISLKRHQKVSGCAESEVVRSAPQRPEPRPAVPAPVIAPAVLITAEQIALWQQEKMLPPAVEPASPSTPSIDWKALQETGLDFAEFAVDQVHALTRAAASMLAVGARFGLFAGFLGALVWVALFGISTGLSAAPGNSLDRQQTARLSAESTVASFLLTSRLGQFERAHEYLSESARQTVSARDLSRVLDKLAEAPPVAISAQLEQADQVARVTVSGAGHAEVYTLVRESRGWGLASLTSTRS